MCRRPKRDAVLLLALAFLLRLVPILAANRLVADVLRYHKVAQGILAGNWNPYTLQRLYPYPPLWVWFEAGSEWLARRLPIGFPVLVKLPILCADLGIVALLLAWPDAERGRRAAWLYALHPVSILVTGFHGQFDALMLVFVLLAVRWHGEGRRDASALALAGAVGFKSVPVLLLPFFALRGGGPRAALRYVLLATAPVALLLLPFALADFPALRRELLGYGGVADFGWIALVRGIDWLRGGTLAKSEAAHWGGLIPLAKLLYVAAYAGMLVAFRRRWLRWSLAEASLAVLLAFQVLYGAVSAQYLLWVVPLAVLAPDRHFAAWSAAATAALLGFYAFLQPAVLLGDPPLLAFEPASAGWLWLAGVAALLVTGLVWLVSLVRPRAAGA